jgi:protein-disulfide isomerase
MMTLPSPDFASFRAWWIAALAAVTLALSWPALASEDRTLFRLNGLDYNASDLPPALRQQMFDAYQRYYDAVSAIVRDAAFDVHVAEVAETSGKDPAAVRDELLPAGAIPQAQLQAFYDQNRQRINAPFAQVKGQIAEYLQRARANAAKTAVVAKLSEQGKLDAGLPAPEVPVVKINTAGFPFKGPAEAPVTIVEFADYQCPHCKAAAPLMREVLKRHAGKVRVVFIDFPINRSGISRLVAKGAVCAEQQGRFWDFHDLAFDNQASLTVSAPTSLAAQLGLDKVAFESCYQSQSPERKVASAEAEAERLGLKSTPTIFVNGQRLRSVRGMAGDLNRAVEQALAQ